MCAAYFHLIIIAHKWMYALHLFLLTIWWSKHWNWNEASAYPYTNLEDMVAGKKSLIIAFLTICVELASGFAVFEDIPMLWAFQLVFTYKNRAYRDCTTILKISYIAIDGAIVESIATCICRMVSCALDDINPRFSKIIIVFVRTSLIVAAFNYTGYCNSALETSFKYDYLEILATEYVLVYWIGACIGSILSLGICYILFMQNFILL